MESWLSLITRFDSTLSQWITALRGDELTVIMRGITSLGSTTGIISLVLGVVLIGLWLRKYFEVITLSFAVLGAFGLSEALKAFLQRARPPLPWLDMATGYSFPSGHSLVSLALYGFLAYWLWRNCRPTRWRQVSMTALVIVPLLIGISRIYLGVHYPSDVLGGWLLAAGWLAIYFKVIEKWRVKRNLKLYQMGGTTK